MQLNLAKKALTAFLWLLFGLFTTINAQYKELGIFGSALYYQGDLTEGSIYLSETQPGFGFVARYPFHKHVGFRFHYLGGSISGSDANSSLANIRSRGYEFKSQLHEVAVGLEIFPRSTSLSNSVGLFNKHRWLPYASGSIAVTLAPGKPVATRVTTLKPNPFPEAEDVDNFISFPLNLGVKYFASEHFVLFGEIGTRSLFSDYLDGISIAANPKKNDWYSVVSLGFSIMFDVETCARNW
jgi:Domain of unknown function (DUF6089)